MRFGEYLIALLERHGVEIVFGIPGVHTAELYRGLSGSRIRHVSPRHEQGAGFMADGYARLTGRPGVCFVITGPGVTNIATAMAQAYQDSIPMLVISGVNRLAELGKGRGNLHELPDQQGLTSKLAAFSHTLVGAEDLPAVLARAFASFAAERPRPVHVEIPIDLMEQDVEGASATDPPRAPSRPDAEELDAAARLLDGAGSPLLLVGGGARRAAPAVAALAERLDAPVVMTVNARGLFPDSHPLGVPASPSLTAVRSLISGSDVVLAIGTELGPTDYDMYGRGGFSIPGRLVRIDIEAARLARNADPDVRLLGDAAAIVPLLFDRLGSATTDRHGRKRAAETRRTAFQELSPAMRRQVEFLTDIRTALPGVVIVGDSTQPVYAGNLFYAADRPAGWFNSATGYGTLGYALPAAIGAKLGAPERPVVCLAGDGGLQFSLGELGSAMDARTPIIVLVWNNRGYGEIKDYMQARGITPEGVDLTTPDFCAIAGAYGLAAERLEHPSALGGLLKAAAARPIPTLIEIDAAIIMSGS